jgi:Zn-dependent peptidase ImmA (M78 family)
LKDRIDINSDAIALRRDFGEDPYSPIDIFSMLNNFESFTIVFYPMSDRISGMCIRDEENKLIAINSALSYGRQRYSAAHELCHLFFHENLKSIICAKDLDSKKRPEEKEADIFASFFLAPYEALNSFIKKKLQKQPHHLDVNDVIKIEQHYGLSRQATLWRLINDGYLTVDATASMKSGIIQSAARLGYDDKLYRPTPSEKQYLTLGKYIELAEELKSKALISNGKYEELLLDSFRADIVYDLHLEGEESYD